MKNRSSSSGKKARQPSALAFESTDKDQGWKTWLGNLGARWHPREWRAYHWMFPEAGRAVQAKHDKAIHEKIAKEPKLGFFAQIWYNIRNFKRNFILGFVEKIHRILDSIRTSTMEKLNKKIRKSEIQNPDEIHQAYQNYLTGATGQNTMMRNYFDNTKKLAKRFLEIKGRLR